MVASAASDLAGPGPSLIFVGLMLAMVLLFIASIAHRTERRFASWLAEAHPAPGSG